MSFNDDEVTDSIACNSLDIVGRKITFNSSSERLVGDIKIELGVDENFFRIALGLHRSPIGFVHCSFTELIEISSGLAPRRKLVTFMNRYMDVLEDNRRQMALTVVAVSRAVDEVFGDQIFKWSANMERAVVHGELFVSRSWAYRYGYGKQPKNILHGDHVSIFYLFEIKSCNNFLKTRSQKLWTVTVIVFWNISFCGAFIMRLFLKCNYCEANSLLYPWNFWNAHSGHICMVKRTTDRKACFAVFR